MSSGEDHPAMRHIQHSGKLPLLMASGSLCWTHRKNKELLIIPGGPLVPPSSAPENSSSLT
eukprot:11305357-Karenia_brevis.AAC.1